MEKGDVVRVLVAVGDLKADQPVLELETDKATIEVPSSVAGRISDVKVKAGEKVKVGQVVLVIDGAGEAAAALKRRRDPAPAAAAPAPEPRRRRPPRASRATPAAPKPGEARRSWTSARRARRRPSNPTTPRRSPPASAPRRARPVSSRPPVPAAPSVRRFARELGVDIARVSGTGPGGRIGQDDVKQHVKATLSGAGGSAAPSPRRSRISRSGARSRSSRCPTSAGRRRSS